MAFPGSQDRAALDTSLDLGVHAQNTTCDKSEPKQLYYLLILVLSPLSCPTMTILGVYLLSHGQHGKSLSRNLSINARIKPSGWITYLNQRCYR